MQSQQLARVCFRAGLDGDRKVVAHLMKEKCQGCKEHPRPMANAIVTQLHASVLLLLPQNWCIHVAVVSLSTLEVSSGIQQLTRDTQMHNHKQHVYTYAPCLLARLHTLQVCPESYI